MVTIKEGDLLTATENIIAHQVNCFGAVGGLAAVIFDRYPAAEHDYNQMVQRNNPWFILGMAQFTGQQPDGHIIANLYGQYQAGADYRPTALRKALHSLAGLAKTMGYSVALPYKISCGICGGDWKEVRQIIEEEMKDVECVIYRRKGD